MKFVLSTVGISPFLNILEPPEALWRKRLNDLTNEQTLPPDVLEKVEELYQRALTRLTQDDALKNRALSAELNGLYGLYGGHLSAGPGDIHFLIATDTLLGQKAAGMVCTYLRTKGFMVDIYQPAHLSSANSQAFSAGIKDLIYWCEQTIPGFRDRHYEIIFNLTGAFKSLQGYLNIMGMLYADQVVYIFESGQQLVTIPRLPIQVDVGALRACELKLALLAQGHIYRATEVQDVPAGLLDIDQHENTSLSDWGVLIWQRVRQEILGEKLLPYPRIGYTSSFQKDFEDANREERVALQETLAKVSSLLESQNGDTTLLKRDGGLHYDNYTGKKAGGLPIGHFRVNDSRRVSCTVENGMLYLRRYGPHSINDNP